MALPDHLTLPLNRLAQIDYEPVAVVGALDASFTGKRQIQVHDGQFWRWTVRYPPLFEPDLSKMEAFVLKANGGERTFLMGDPSKATPRGAASSSPGTPVVDGNNQLGQVLAVRGGPASTSGWLLEGDFVQINTAASATLHKVLTDAGTDAAGETTLDIWPRIRTAHPDGTAIAVSDAKGLFVMDNPVNGWTVTSPRIGALQFAVREFW